MSESEKRGEMSEIERRKKKRGRARMERRERIETGKEKD